MKRNVLNGIAALLVSASAAYAADMSVPPPAPPVPVNSWTGFYFDVALGWQQNAYNWTWNNPAALAAGAGAVGMPSTNGGSIGGHIGYQQQFGWLLAGVEIGGANSTNAPWSTSVPSVGVLPCGLATLACSATVGATYTVNQVILPHDAEFAAEGRNGAHCSTTGKRR